MASLPASCSPIFRKYIGGMGMDTVLKNVLNVPLKKTQPLHLVFPFANDACCDGPFGTNWSQNYRSTLQRIAELKSDDKYKEAKLILSIGDYYNQRLGVPKSDHWIRSATDIIAHHFETYKFDGLDLSYSKIDDNSKDTFVQNMAGLFRQLRDISELKGKIFSVTPTPTFDDCYSKLYSELTYGGEKECFDILVNYKFYVNTTKGPLRNTLDFKGAIEEVLQKYPGAKLLMGYSTDQNDIGIPEKQVFIETYKQMKQHLSGIFVWSDNTSACSVIETEAEELLAGDSGYTSAVSVDIQKEPAGQLVNECGCSQVTATTYVVVKQTP